MSLIYLKIAGGLSFAASVMHIAIIVGGASWYRFFGAGEQMARMAEQGLLQPTIITVSIVLMLAVFGAYAWSAAGVFSELPRLKPILALITLVYLLRGVVGLVAPFISSHPQITQNSLSFWVYSSIICLLFGLIHWKGFVDKW
jgi:putative oxidoreductase